MHVVIAFAAPASAKGREALAQRRWRVLPALLAALRETVRDPADEHSFSPPHERALAGVTHDKHTDGRLPLAAAAARADGIATGHAAWGLVTPAHWLLGAEQVRMGDPAALDLHEDEARALFDALRPLIESEGDGAEHANADGQPARRADGMRFVWGSAQRWYLAHDSLDGLRTASLDRVIHRNIDRWIGADPAARRVRRLQSEVQMLLHTHPVNAAREARGAPVVNSFWLSGCGRESPRPLDETAPAAAAVAEWRLRGPALADDWQAWSAAWDGIEGDTIAPMLAAHARGSPVRLVLCGESAAAHFASPAHTGLFARALSLLRRAPEPNLLLAAL